MITAVARTRAFTKWRNSNKIIGDLKNNPVKTRKGKKLTWMQSASRWVSRTKVDTDQHPETIKEEIIDYYYKRNKEKEKAQICRIADENAFDQNNLFKKTFAECDNEHVHAMLRIKCGTITWTPELKRYPNNNIPVECIGCGVGVESLHHYLEECELYTEERQELKEKIGDSTSLAECMKNKKFMIELIEYCGKTLKKRNMKLWRTMNP